MLKETPRESSLREIHQCPRVDPLAPNRLLKVVTSSSGENIKLTPSHVHCLAHGAPEGDPTW
jgi:hypothetical protein